MPLPVKEYPDPAGASLESCVHDELAAPGVSRVKMYTVPLLALFPAPASCFCAPKRAMSPLIATVEPKKAEASMSPATSLARCTHWDPAAAPVSRPNMYADPAPLTGPGSSSLNAPIAMVSPLISTLHPKLSLPVSLAGISFWSCVQPDVRSPAVSLLKTYADPAFVSPDRSSYIAPATMVSPSIATL